MPICLIKPCTLLVEIKTSSDTMEVNLEVSKNQSKKTNNNSNNNKTTKRLTIDISLASAVCNTPVYFPKTFQSSVPRHTCTAVVTSALFTVAKIQSQPRCLAIEEWIRKMAQMHTVSISTIKRNDTVIFRKMDVMEDDYIK